MVQSELKLCPDKTLRFTPLLHFSSSVCWDMQVYKSALCDVTADVSPRSVTTALCLEAETVGGSKQRA